VCERGDLTELANEFLVFSRDGTRLAVADLAQRFPAPRTTSVMVGDPDKCIALAAREHSVDLVLMSRASGQLQAAYRHDVAHTFGKLHCPLFTVPIDARIPVQSHHRHSCEPVAARGGVHAGIGTQLRYWRARGGGFNE
jgi:hypothetical protein